MSTERTIYGYKNREGERLYIMADRIFIGHVMVSITGVGDLEPHSMAIPDAEVPGIALAMLRAAGYGQIHEHLPHHDDIPSMVELAAGHLSDAVTVMEQETARKQIAADLTRRRNELAQKLVGDAAYAYRFAGETLQAAIDMIIQLQDEAAK